MSNTAEANGEDPIKGVGKWDVTKKPDGEIPGKASSRKEKRKEWWKTKQISSCGMDTEKQDLPVTGENSAQQISRLRNRETIAKPDSLQYEPNLNRGFHAKILHSLYNGTSKKKKDQQRGGTMKEKECTEVNKGKRKSSDASADSEVKKAKEDFTTAPSEIFDSYAFSMKLINGEEDKVKSQNVKGKDSKNKYVLFIGNLPHDVTREQLEEHFRKTGGIKAIRIPREKGNDKGRGFAYMEFDGRISHGIALRLHETTLGGRKINVEFTSIGGGKSLARREKLCQKNIKRRKMKM